MPADSADQRGQTLGGGATLGVGPIVGIVIGGLAALLVLALLMRWRTRIHQTHESLAEGDESRTSEREAADRLVSQTAQARLRSLQVRVPRLERVCRA